MVALCATATRAEEAGLADAAANADAETWHAESELWEVWRWKVGLNSPMALAEVEALALASIWGWARQEAWLRGGRGPSIRDTLDSLNRHGAVREVWRHSQKQETNI